MLAGNSHYFYGGPSYFGYPYSYYGPNYYESYPYGYGGYALGGSEQQGYYDGLNRGREDVLNGRSYDPNHSSHFRNGSATYRDGFLRGYEVGYSQG
jgi:hypothetical protein